jgi:hypothetical protein
MFITTVENQSRAVFAKPKVVVLYKLNCKHPAASAKMSVSSADSGLY